ncbi:MAG TPA: hypothetical protein VF781_01385 [Solirubrobacteraceae bacterium]
MRGFHSTSPLRQRLTLPPRAAAVHEHERHPREAGHLGVGTLACPRCDAPVAIGPGPRAIVECLRCPYCDNHGPVRDFLSLGAPTRPARVELRVRLTGTASR